jgi:hypothetical protein
MFGIDESITKVASDEHVLKVANVCKRKARWGAGDLIE